MRKIGFDFFLIALAFLFLVGFFSYFHRFFGVYQEAVEIDLSVWRLPQYVFFSFSRGFFAFAVSFFFSLVFGFWAAKDRVAEKFLVPLLDILQSIPVLGFLPGVVLLFIGFSHRSNAGLEMAAILLIFTGQVWNMIFSVYHAIRTVPAEKNECARVYGFTAWQRFRWIELPFSSPGLIWNSILSVAGGWFFLMVAEAFALKGRDFRLPGLGAYMSVASSQGDTLAMIFAIVAMVGLIFCLNQLFWNPLVVWSKKFRIEETSSPQIKTSWFLNGLKNSLLIARLRSFSCSLTNFLQNRKAKTAPWKADFGKWGSIASRVLLAGFIFCVGVAVFSTGALLRGVEGSQWLYFGKLFSLTFCRVYFCVLISVFVMLPLGLAIGLSNKWTQRLQPLIQVGASFPASLLFPLAIFVFQWLHIPLGIGSLVLMLLGTQWYVLFNVIAGARAMPSDLREVAASFRYNRIQRFVWLYLPAVFPYLITGILSAAGGAWNTSIVAEYVDYNNQIFTVPGIGSSISIAAQNNDYAGLAASIVVMMSGVAFINYLVWLRLYHYSEQRFALNA